MPLAKPPAPISANRTAPARAGNGFGFCTTVDIVPGPVWLAEEYDNSTSSGRFGDWRAA